MIILQQRAALVTLALALTVSTIAFLNWNGSAEPPRFVPIFQGIRFRVQGLPDTSEGRGKVYMAIADLRSPGLELYVTPLDREALAQGWHYRLRRISEVIRAERLSVVINGPMFSSYSPLWFRMPGDLASSAYGTLVSDHAVAVIQRHSDVIWFDDWLRPHLTDWDSPKLAADLSKAKWGVGGSIVMRNGKPVGTPSTQRDSRTMVGVDGDRIILSVAEDISPRLLAQMLAAEGATDVMVLDGGTSSAMAIGSEARGVASGVVVGGWRPVPTFFGFRSPQIRAK